MRLKQRKDQEPEAVARGVSWTLAAFVVAVLLVVLSILVFAFAFYLLIGADD